MTDAPEQKNKFNLSALAVRERAVTLFFIIVISLAGIVAFLSLGRAEDPGFTIKAMTIERVISRLSQGRSRMCVKPSIVICPASVPVIVELRPAAIIAIANAVGSSFDPSR